MVALERDRFKVRARSAYFNSAAVEEFQKHIVLGAERSRGVRTGRRGPTYLDMIGRANIVLAWPGVWTRAALQLEKYPLLYETIYFCLALEESCKHWLHNHVKLFFLKP